MAMRLVGAVSEGSGAVNEDGCFAGSEGGIEAAWIFDGVTGINGCNYLPGGSDAQWLVNRAHHHLARLAGSQSALPTLIASLVELLIVDWREISAGLEFPADYDPPAACLILVKRFGETWQMARLGDSCLLARADDGSRRIVAASPNNAFDNWLAREAEKRRAAGVPTSSGCSTSSGRNCWRTRPATRRAATAFWRRAAARNAPNISILKPADLLLCTDGFYRAVDHYGLLGDEELIEACGAAGGVRDVLARVRAAEAADPECRKYRRFKPADDATAVMLRKLP
jgi:serine/threonine protein phosphatase PrpC